MIDLLIQYKQTRRETKKLIDHTTDEYELKILRSIIADLDYSIDWMQKGHAPNSNAIDKIQCYVINPTTIEAVIDSSGYNKVSDDEYQDFIRDVNNPISHALRKLTQKELEVFLMIECEKMRYTEVAELLGVGKSTIQKNVERSKEKIRNELESNLFL